MKTIILHADIDAFYASVEQLDNPLYRNRPVIVGGGPNGRGVVSAASYEARKFGIHSAMPTSQAYRLCPQAIFLGLRMNRYRQLSYKFRAILSSLTLNIEPLSLDEAYVDVSENTLKTKDPFAIAYYIQERMTKELELPVSIGVGPNKLIAKMASEIDKPKGLLVVEPEQVLDFLDPLPVSTLWGVGKKTVEKMQQEEIHTVEDLRDFSKVDLNVKFGNFGTTLYHMARGIDYREVSSKKEMKNLGAERTFSKDVDNIAELERYLFGICLEVAKRAKSKKVWAKTITLKYKDNLFQSRTKSKTINKYIQKEDDLYQCSNKLLQNLELNQPLRLLGLSLSNFKSNHEEKQLSLF